MKGEIVEIVCGDVRGSFSRVRSIPLVKEAQAFGDRLNVLVENAGRDMPSLLNAMKQEKIDVQTWRIVPPSLENVFISLMSEHPVSPTADGNLDSGADVTLEGGPPA